MAEAPRTSTARAFFIATVIVAVLYLPLAINYTWPLFSAGVPRLQDGVNTFVNGRAYAVGDGSVEAVRGADYAQHKIVMLIHTTLGALALGLAMFQFSARLRTRRPTMHRWIGRTYLALMTASMLTAITFLLVTTPVKHFIGRAFDLQLWALALGTLGGGWYALYAIRSRDVVTHRAWMGYGIALMMTAPLLRVLWIGIQPVIPQHELLTNLGASAMVLGVAAPFGAAVAFMLTHRGRGSRTARPASPRTYAAIVVAAALASIVYAALSADLPDSVPHSLAAYHLVPAWLAMAIALAGVRNARANGDVVREQRWRWLLCGVSAAPAAASTTALLAAPVYTATDAFVAGGMVGAPVAITVAFALVVHAAATPKRAAVVARVAVASAAN
jgi:uncharacterized membrane protein